MKTLNTVYTSLSTRRRYEVWFVRLGLADMSGAWWFRYLLMNPGRSGCVGNPRGSPVQVWATWFPKQGRPQSFIQGYPLDGLELSAPGESPFLFHAGDNQINETSCRGALDIDRHRITWDLHYRSSLHATLSSRGWIGFSRTPHSHATFAGQIKLDDRIFDGDPLGFGLQGHNCGYRHRTFWRWAHACFPAASSRPAAIEALAYDMPLGLVFRKAVLFHEGKRYVFRGLRESVNRDAFAWSFSAASKDGWQLGAAFDGSGLSLHRLPYLKTDCSGDFEVVNNSFANAVVRLKRPGGGVEELTTSGGAVLEMGGKRN
ncbi:MAG TPA: hypothetical protein VGF08_04445 [Terriglobales bacterium]|jgi:hypothetical protein